VDEAHLTANCHRLLAGPFTGAEIANATDKHAGA